MDERAGANADYPRALHGYAILALLVLTFIISYVDRQVLGLLVKPIKADLGIGDFEISLLVGFAFALFYCGFGIPIGRLADRMSRKYLILIGILLWSIATMLSGFAASFAALFLFRMLVGIGEAALAPASYSMLGDLFPPHRLVRATAILGLAANLSAGLALIIGGQVIAYATHVDDLPFGLMALAPWQRTMVLVGVPGLAMALFLLLIREPQRRGVAQEDAQVGRHAFRFLWRQRRDYLPVYGTAAGMAMTTYGGVIWFPTHIIRTFGSSPAEAGALLGTIQIVGAVGGAGLGVALTEKLMKRGHADAHLRSVMWTALGVIPAMMALFMPTLESTAALWLVAALFQSTYYGNLSAALQIVTPNRARGTNIAIFYLIINIFGLAGGTALIGAVAQWIFPGDSRGIGYGIALTGVAGPLLAVFSAWRGMRAYRTAALRVMPEAEVGVRADSAPSNGWKVTA